MTDTYNLVFISSTQRLVLEKNLPRDRAEEKARRLTALSPPTVKYVAEKVE